MKYRSPLTVFLLSLITFGIYDLYWLVSTKNVLNKKTRQHVPSIWILVLPFILLIAGYIGIFAFAGHIGSSTSTVSSGVGIYGSTTTTTSSTSLAHPAEFLASVGGIIIGWIALIFVSVFWFFRFSKAVNEYTKGKMSTAVTFLILWLIHLIGVALVQDAFNDMSPNRQ